MAVRFGRQNHAVAGCRFRLAGLAPIREFPRWGSSRSPSAVVWFKPSRGFGMIRSLAFAVAVGSAALLSSASAGALPVGPASAPAVTAADSDVLLVRDGC